MVHVTKYGSLNYKSILYQKGKVVDWYFFTMILIIVTRCNGYKNESNWHGNNWKWNSVPNIWGSKVKQKYQNTEILCTLFYAKEVCVIFTFLLTVFSNLHITIHKHAPKLMIYHSSAYIKCQKLYPLRNLSYLRNHH